MLSENLPSPCDLGAMKVPRPATPNATSALPPTGHGDLRHGGEGNKRDFSGVAGPSRIGRSHGTRQPLKALIVFFLVFFPCCTEAVTEAVGWKWGALGASCTTTCASEGQTCVQSEFLKVIGQASFDALKGPRVVCAGGSASQSYDVNPGFWDYSGTTWKEYCKFGNQGTCDGYETSPAYNGLYAITRVCPCTCPANTFSSPSTLQPWPCPR